MSKFLLVTIMLFSFNTLFSQELTRKDNGKSEQLFNSSEILKYLEFPKRPQKARGASEFVLKVSDLNRQDREKVIIEEIQMGNVPSFSRLLIPISVSDSLGNQLTFYATADYLAIGSDEDYMYVPITPLSAQVLANQLDCILPTQKIVDLIYAHAETKLKPQPIPPSEEMTTLPVFWQHSDSIKQQMNQISFDRFGQSSVAGHKKDIIIANRIFEENKNTGQVVIYGWHQNANSPIQPVYAGHSDTYADYSHGVRFVSKVGFLNGVEMDLEVVLKEQDFCSLVSTEGIISKPYYPFD